MCIRNNERLLPCCLFDDKEPSVQLNDFNGNAEAAYNSPYYRQMRKNALEGKENPGCRSCYFREKETPFSTRNHANLDWRESYDGEVSPLANVTYLEVFTGNLCNLRCLMCGPELSSSLADDYVKLGWASSDLKSVIENDYRELLSKLPNLKRLKFVGGEPLFGKKHWELLASIPGERARNITLEYSTNGTVFPSAEQLQLWRSFAGVEVTVSIDGHSTVNEYVRFPSRWSIVEKNTRKFKEFCDERSTNVFGINTAVSIYNVFDFDVLISWILENFGEMKSPAGTNTLYSSCVIYPEYLRVQNLPKDIKEELLQKLPDTKAFKLTRASLKLDGDVSQISEFRERTRSFEKIRNIKYQDFVPSLKRVMEGAL